MPVCYPVSITLQTRQLKNKMIFRIVPLFFLFVITNTGFSQNVLPKKNMAVDARILADSSRALQPDSTQINVFSSQEAFDYHRTVAGKISYWDDMKSWLWNHFFRYIPQTIFNKYFGWLCLAALVISVGFIIYKFIRGDVEGGIAKTHAITASRIVGSTDTAEHLDYNAKIAQLERDGDFREAIRWYYLKMLHMLAKHGLITLAEEKTNATYCDELQAPQQKKQFQLLTRHFEWSWFGDFPINQQQYLMIQADFSAMFNLVERDNA